jgi:hypothetical protein
VALNACAGRGVAGQDADAAQHRLLEICAELRRQLQEAHAEAAAAAEVAAVAEGRLAATTAELASLRGAERQEARGPLADADAALLSELVALRARHGAVGASAGPRASAEGASQSERELGALLAELRSLRRCGATLAGIQVLSNSCLGSVFVSSLSPRARRQLDEPAERGRGQPSSPESGRTISQGCRADPT